MEPRHEQLYLIFRLIYIPCAGELLSISSHIIVPVFDPEDILHPGLVIRTSVWACERQVENRLQSLHLEYIFPHSLYGEHHIGTTRNNNITCFFWFSIPNYDLFLQFDSLVWKFQIGLWWIHNFWRVIWRKTGITCGYLWKLERAAKTKTKLHWLDFSVYFFTLKK